MSLLNTFSLYPHNSLPGRVKQIVHQAFWDRLEEDLNEDPPEYEHAIKLFEEIKEVSLTWWLILLSHSKLGH